MLGKFGKVHRYFRQISQTTVVPYTTLHYLLPFRERRFPSCHLYVPRPIWGDLWGGFRAVGRLVGRVFGQIQLSHFRCVP